MTRPILNPESRSNRPRLLFYCQHAMGLGHLVRSAALVHGLRNFEVTFINAGDVVDGFRFQPSVEVVNLPPLKIGDDLSTIQDQGETDAFWAAKALRKERLVSVWQDVQPEIVVIELFPFGRKKFEFELIPLLREILLTKASTKVVCSLRDILVSRNDQPEWEEKVCRLANAYFDLILVHSDPRFQRLEETFGRVSDLRCEVYYTGFVAQSPYLPAESYDEPLRLPNDGKPLIVASIGGGRIGGELLACTIQASASLQNTLPHHLILITGPRFPEAEWRDLARLVRGNPGISLMRYTERFLEYLENADLSISLAGYNTCMNILTTGVRALVYPITGYNADEQIIRSHKLEALGAVSVIRPEELTADALSRKVLSALEQKDARARVELDTGGVENTARILMELAGERGIEFRAGRSAVSVDSPRPASLARAARPTSRNSLPAES